MDGVSYAVPLFMGGALIKLADVNAPVAAPTPPRAQLVSLPPAVKPAPKAKVVAQAPLPVPVPPAAAEAPPLTDVVLAAKPSPAMEKALAQLGEAAPKVVAKTGTTGTTLPAPKATIYETKPVVIVLPPAHFAKTAPDADGTTALPDKPAKPKKIAKSVTKPAAKPAVPHGNGN